jgi:hypothetical protein
VANGTRLKARKQADPQPVEHSSGAHGKEGVDDLSDPVRPGALRFFALWALLSTEALEALEAKGKSFWIRSPCSSRWQLYRTLVKRLEQIEHRPILVIQ